MIEPAAPPSDDSPELVFMHTAAIHVHPFDSLLRELRPEVRARHVVRADLLAAAQVEGADAPSVKSAVADAVAACVDARPGAVALCTCSTIGGLAESAAASTGVRMIRVDRAMAERAVEAGPNIYIVAAAASTLAPTRALILESALRAGVRVKTTPLLLKDAWPLFERGEFDAYLKRIADALKRVKGGDVVVLAQASMAGAEELCPTLGVPVLSSPRSGLESALAALGASTGAPGALRPPPRGW